MNSKWKNFVVGALIHENIKEKDGKYAVKVKDLTFDMVKDVFTDKYQKVHFTREQPDGKEGPVYKDNVSFTLGDGSLRGIVDSKALEQWKRIILNIKGIDPDVEVILDPSPQAAWFDKAIILDPVFIDREEAISKGIQAFYDKAKIDKKTGGRYTGD